MNFALWKNITPPTGIVTGPDGEHHRGVGKQEVVRYFIVNIPDNTAQNEVVLRLSGFLRNSSEIIEATDSLAFEDQWPEEVHAQFNADAHPKKRLTWSSLK